MVKLKFLIPIFTFCILITSCNKEQVVKANSDLFTDQEVLKIMDYIVLEYDYEKSDLYWDKDYNIIGAGLDIEFPIDNFWEEYGPVSIPSRSHRIHDNIVTSTNTVNIGFDTSLPFSWKLAIIRSCGKYNNLNGDISFTYDASNFRESGHDIWVSQRSYRPSGSIARTRYPNNNGEPGFNMWLNSNYPGYLNLYDMEFVIAHEIGHAIGMRHTDTNHGNQIPNLPVNCNDNNNDGSLMRTHLHDHSSRTFSSCDILSFQEIY